MINKVSALFCRNKWCRKIHIWHIREFSVLCIETWAFICRIVFARNIRSVIDLKLAEANPLVRTDFCSCYLEFQVTCIFVNVCCFFCIIRSFMIRKHRSDLISIIRFSVIWSILWTESHDFFPCLSVCRYREFTMSDIVMLAILADSFELIEVDCLSEIVYEPNAFVLWCLINSLCCSVSVERFLRICDRIISAFWMQWFFFELYRIYNELFQIEFHIIIRLVDQSDISCISRFLCIICCPLICIERCFKGKLVCIFKILLNIFNLMNAV